LAEKGAKVHQESAAKSQAMGRLSNYKGCFGEEKIVANLQCKRMHKELRAKYVLFCTILL
jgi:hypothetical protein